MEFQHFGWRQCSLDSLAEIYLRSDNGTVTGECRTMTPEEMQECYQWVGPAPKFPYQPNLPTGV
jgi:hypothetical protein